MADVVRGILAGAESLGKALGSYQQVKHNIQRDKEVRAERAEQQTYQREQDALRNQRADTQLARQGEQQDFYRGLAGRQEERSVEKHATNKAFKTFGNVQALQGKSDSIMAEMKAMESQSAEMGEGVDVSLSPRYQQLKQALDSSKKSISQYMLTDPDAKKLLPQFSASASGDDASANLAAKMSGTPVRYNQGNMQILDEETGEVIQEISKEEAAGAMADIEGIQGVTYDQESKSFFDTASKQRFDMNADALKPGEKYMKYGDSLFRSFQEGTIDNADLESVGIISEGDQVSIPTVDKSGRITGVKKQKMSPEAFVAARKANKDRRDRVDKFLLPMVKSGQAKITGFDKDGNPNIELKAVPKKWTERPIEERLGAEQMISQYINNSQVIKPEVIEEYDDEGNLTKKIVRSKVSKTRELSVDQIKQLKNDFADAYKLSYSSIFSKVKKETGDPQKARSEALKGAEDMARRMIPGIGEQIKSQGEVAPKKGMAEKKPIDEFKGMSKASIEDIEKKEKELADKSSWMKAPGNAIDALLKNVGHKTKEMKAKAYGSLTDPSDPPHLRDLARLSGKTISEVRKMDKKEVIRGIMSRGWDSEQINNLRNVVENSGIWVALSTPQQQTMNMMMQGMFKDKETDKFIRSLNVSLRSSPKGGGSVLGLKWEGSGNKTKFKAGINSMKGILDSLKDWKKNFKNKMVPEFNVGAKKVIGDILNLEKKIKGK